MSRYADDDDSRPTQDNERARRIGQAKVQRYQNMKTVYAYIREHDLPEPGDETKYLQVHPWNVKELAERFGVEIVDVPDEDEFAVRRQESGQDFLVKVIDLETTDVDTKKEIEKKRALLPPD